MAQYMLYIIANVNNCRLNITGMIGRQQNNQEGKRPSLFRLRGALTKHPFSFFNNFEKSPYTSLRCIIRPCGVR